MVAHRAVRQPTLRTDERRVLLMLADGYLLAACPSGSDGRPRAWVPMSRYAGDVIPVGWDVFARLAARGEVAFVRRGRRGVTYHAITPEGSGRTASP